MKKILLIIALLISVFVFNAQNKQLQENDSNSQSLSKAEQDLLTIETNSGKFSSIWFKLDKKDNILFNINSQGLGSYEIVNQYSCDYLVNGGFYDEEFKPLGLVTINNERIQQPISSSLFNGFLSFDSNNSTSINKTPSQNPLIEIQTGPIILFNRQKQNISPTGKLARRVLVVIDSDNNTYFIALYDPENVYSGPALSEIYDILTRVEESLNTKFKSAINLDGGSASVFYTKTFKLPEIKTIGSYFCIKNK